MGSFVFDIFMGLNDLGFGVGLCLQGTFHGGFLRTKSCIMQQTDLVKITSLEKEGLEVFTGGRHLMVYRLDFFFGLTSWMVIGFLQYYAFLAFTANSGLVCIYFKKKKGVWFVI